MKKKIKKVDRIQACDSKFKRYLAALSASYVVKRQSNSFQQPKNELKFIRLGSQIFFAESIASQLASFVPIGSQLQPVLFSFLAQGITSKKSGQGKDDCVNGLFGESPFYILVSAMCLYPITITFSKPCCGMVSLSDSYSSAIHFWLKNYPGRYPAKQLPLKWIFD